LSNPPLFLFHTFDYLIDNPDLSRSIVSIFGTSAFLHFCTCVLVYLFTCAHVSRTGYQISSWCYHLHNRNESLSPDHGLSLDRILFKISQKESFDFLIVPICHIQCHVSYSFTLSLMIESIWRCYERDGHHIFTAITLLKWTASQRDMHSRTQSRV
jgi:hypothetical protein